MKTITRPRFTHLLFGLIAIVALGLSFACSDDDDDNNTQQGSESAVCGDANQVNESIDRVKDLNSSSSISEITGSLTALGTSLTDLQSSLKDAKYDKTDELQAAGSDLRDSLSKAVSSGSIAGAQAQLNQTATELQDRVDDAKSKNGCD
jgi:hypothetical protein